MDTDFLLTWGHSAGFFPTYRDSPLAPRWDRTLQVRRSVSLLAKPAATPSMSFGTVSHSCVAGSGVGLHKLRRARAGPDVLCCAPPPVTLCCRVICCLYTDPQVGDASGIQSPLSFGGFGALTRHLGRLTTAITEALQVSGFSPATALPSRSLAVAHREQSAHDGDGSHTAFTTASPPAHTLRRNPSDGPRAPTRILHMVPRPDGNHRRMRWTSGRWAQ